MNTAYASTSPWRPRDDAAALLAWPAGTPALVVQLLQGAWQGWARDWGLGGACETATTCSEADAGSGPADAWTVLGRGRRGTAWICAAPEQEAQLAQELFETASADTPVVGEVLAACRADACLRLASALQIGGGAGECAPAPTTLLEPWSGALLACLPLAGRVLLDAALVRTLLPAGAGTARPQGAPKPLVAVHRAAAGLTLPLQVRLDACEVDIGSLQDLQAGDVVRLPHRLDAPLAVLGPGGQPLFGGYLVRRRGRKAVELAPTGAAAIAGVEEEMP